MRRVLLTEKRIQSDILATFGSLPWIRLWRNNTGLFITPDGRRPVTVGLPGSPDLIGIIGPTRSRPSGGLFLGIEVKSPTGALNLQQKRFAKMSAAMGAIYIVARSVGDVWAAFSAHGISAPSSAPSETP